MTSDLERIAEILNNPKTVLDGYGSVMWNQAQVRAIADIAERLAKRVRDLESTRDEHLGTIGRQQYKIDGLAKREAEARKLITPLADAWEKVRTTLNENTRDLDAVFFWSCGDAEMPFSLGKRARAYLDGGE